MIANEGGSSRNTIEKDTHFDPLLAGPEAQAAIIDAAKMIQ
jgi:hypothetical protein